MFFNRIKLLYQLNKYATMCIIKKNRPIHTRSTLFNENNNDKTLVVRDSFADVKQKDKTTYLDLIKIFENRDKHRRGHVEFIQTALKHMEEFGVHKDLESYKALINVLPKGKFIPQNIFQAEFMHYPKQQQVAIDLLDQMEMNGVMPDQELELILLNIFGTRGHPCRKLWRMMYWMPKFKNLSPWPLPNPLPNEPKELARLAIQRISSVDLKTEVKEYNTENVQDSVDKTWIISAQSPKQKDLINKLPINESIYVEGPSLVWIRDVSINYFILRAEPKPAEDFENDDIDDVSRIRIPFYEKSQKVMIPQSVHEQDDGIILAICATGTSTQNSLLSWIRLMETDGNPALEKLPIVFTLRQPTRELTVTKTDTNKTDVTTIQDKNLT